MTSSNNLHKTLDVASVDAACNYAVGDVDGIIKSAGAYTTPRSISTIVSFMFARGAFFGTRYHGLVKHEAGVYDLASTQRGLQVMQAAAVTGTKSIIETPSIAIAVGNPIPLGTGASYPQISKEMKAAFEAKAPAITQVSVEDIMDELGSMSLPPDADSEISNVGLGLEVDIAGTQVSYPTLRSRIAPPGIGGGSRVDLTPRSIITSAFVICWWATPPRMPRSCGENAFR